jgi:hypothetical protein
VQLLDHVQQGVQEAAVLVDEGGVAGLDARIELQGGVPRADNARPYGERRLYLPVTFGAE